MMPQLILAHFPHALGVVAGEFFVGTILLMFRDLADLLGFLAAVHAKFAANEHFIDLVLQKFVGFNVFVVAGLGMAATIFILQSREIDQNQKFYRFVKQDLQNQAEQFIQL